MLVTSVPFRYKRGLLLKEFFISGISFEMKYIICSYMDEISGPLDDLVIIRYLIISDLFIMGVNCIYLLIYLELIEEARRLPELILAYRDIWSWLGQARV